MQYIPSDEILTKYADVLVNFALNNYKGIKEGEVVRLIVSESAKPMLVALRKAVLKAGAHMLVKYIPDDEGRYNLSKDFYTLASDTQLTYFPKKYLRGLVDTIDHSIAIISETNKRALEDVDPAKIMKSQQASKPYMDWLNEKENNGNFTWTLALYGTEEMANEAGLELKAYWKQIISACFLDTPDPVNQWKQVYKEIEAYRTALNDLDIDTIHIKGEDADLTVKIGNKRRWKAGSGRNIPSFEIFTSPDWRGTQGWIRFNQPLYRYGNLIKGVELEFTKGRVSQARATQNQHVLQEMIRTQNADKVGEISLTDSRHSRITKFMAETLYDENVGGPQGNTHLALGKSYHDCYSGDPSKLDKKDWKDLGFNDSVVHTDIVSTTRRTVTATLHNGQKKIIYKDGKFTL